MKEGWKMVKLGEICETTAGGTPSKTHKEYYEGGKIPWMLSGEVCQKYIYEVEHYITSEGLENSSAKLFPINSVVVAMYGATAGQVGILKIETSTNQAVCGILPNDKMSPEFLYYYFLYYKDILVAQAVGNAQPNISQQKIKAVEIPLLSLEEQHHIVGILDVAFAKIDALKKNAEENLANAKALFQQVLAQELKPKEGWRKYILENICTNIVDCPHSTPKKSDEITNYPCIRTSELRNGKIYWDSMQYLDKYEYEKRVVRLIPKAGDIVYGREGTFGDAVLLPDGYNFSLGQRTMLLRPDTTIVCSVFLLITMISPYVYKQAKDKNSGCGVGHVNVKDIKKFTIYLPDDISEQHRIVSTLDTLSEKCRRLEQVTQQTIRECDALKQSILRQAFSGEL